MTVGEAIRKLKQFPEEAELVFEYNEDSIAPGSLAFEADKGLVVTYWLEEANEDLDLS